MIGGPMVRIVSLTFGLLWSVAALASGAGSGPGTDFYVYIVDFLILMVPLAILVAPRLRQMLRSRHEAVRQEIEDAQALLRQAEHRLREAETRMSHFEEDAAALIEEFRRQGQAEREVLLQEGARLARKLEDDAEFRLSQAVKVARAELVDAMLNRAFSVVEQRAGAQSYRPVPDRVVARLLEEVKA